MSMGTDYISLGADPRGPRTVRWIGKDRRPAGTHPPVRRKGVRVRKRRGPGVRFSPLRSRNGRKSVIRGATNGSPDERLLHGAHRGRHSGWDSSPYPAIRFHTLAKNAHRSKTVNVLLKTTPIGHPVLR